MKTAKELALMAARALSDKKGREIQVLEIGDLTTLADYFVIATGSSNTQINALVDNVEKVLREEAQEEPLHREGYRAGTWVLLDYGCIAIHVFNAEARGGLTAMKLVVDQLQKRFGTQEVLRGASFTFEQGKIYGLIGRNGAGKTTFFNCLNEDLAADGGSFHLEDDTGAARPVTADDMGYVLSTPVVPEFLTAREFLQFFLEINRGKIPYPKAPDVYLDYMCIDPADRGKLLKDFSHGMKNKMQMLVNIMADPAVLLLDEPLSSFDVVVADEMKALLRRIKTRHIILLSTHIMDLALDLCDDIVILHHGVLQEVRREDLADEAYKDRIIAALKEEPDVV